MNVNAKLTNNSKPAGKVDKAQGKAKAEAKGDEEQVDDSVSLSYLPQSPGLLPQSQVEFSGKLEPGPIGSRLKVSVPRTFPTAEPDEDGNFHFSQDDPRFDSVNTYAVAQQTLAISEMYADREIPWSFTDELDREQMIIHPHAGKNLANAFYSSNAGSINFFSYQDKERNMYRTGVQSDVVSHEVGHAVLDAIRPTYIKSFSVPSGGYHESFGDMLSMIRALHEKKVVDHLKAETKGDLSKSNIATKLAEQLGASLVGTPYLRDAVNNHKFADQHFLTYLGNKKEDKSNSFGTEPHAYANLFTGAFYDLLQAKYNQVSMDPDKTFHQSIAETRDFMGKLLFRATELAPMGNPAYPEMALAFLQADALDNEGANKAIIAEVFGKRKILTQDAFQQNEQKLQSVPKVRLRKAAMKEKGANQFLKDRREELGLPKDVEFKFESAFKNNKGETYINYSSSQLGDLDDPDFGTNEGSRFKAVGGLTLLFDPKGKLMAANHDEITEREMTNIKSHIRERSLANQFKAFDGTHGSHSHSHSHAHSDCGSECGHSHGHNDSLLYTISNDGSGPILAKAPVVYC